MLGGHPVRDMCRNRTNYGNHRGGYNMIQYQSKKCRSQQSKIKPVKISQYDLPGQHVLVNTSQLCETLSPVDPNGNNFPQIASPPLPPWNLRIWRVFVVSPHEKPSCSSTTIGLGEPATRINCGLSTVININLTPDADAHAVSKGIFHTTPLSDMTRCPVIGRTRWERPNQVPFGWSWME
jgi:hypothetical protein